MFNNKNYIKNGYDNEQPEHGRDKIDADRKLGVYQQERAGRRRGGEKVCQILDFFRESGGNIGISKQEQVKTLRKFYEGKEIPKMSKYLDLYEETKPLKMGSESLVYLVKDKNGDKKVLKDTDWLALSRRHDGLLQFVVNKIVLQNTIFPETPYVLRGLSNIKDDIIFFVLEQPYIEPLIKEKVIEANLSEVDEDMKKRGFVRINDLYVSQNYTVFDLIRKDDNNISLRTDNVIKSKEGNLHYIDPIIQLNVNNGRNYDEFLNN
jgi:hypothetical protein